MSRCPNAEEMVKRDLEKASKHIENLEAAIGVQQSKLDEATEEASDLRAELAILEAMS